MNNSTGGAIYGGSVGIAATTLNNAATSATATAPVIAARDAAGRVDLGVVNYNSITVRDNANGTTLDTAYIYVMSFSVTDEGPRGVT